MISPRTTPQDISLKTASTGKNAREIQAAVADTAAADHKEIPDPDRNFRIIRRLLAGIFVLLLVGALGAGRDAVAPMFVGFFIAITFKPVIRRLSRRGIPPWLSALAFVIVIAVGSLVLAYAATGPLVDLINNAADYQRIFQEKLHAVRESLRSILALTERLQDAASLNAPAAQKEVVVQERNMMTYIGYATGYSVGIFAAIAFALVIAAFLMASGDLFYEKLVRVLPTLTDKKTALRIVYDVENEVSAYLLSVTAINAALGIAIGVSYFFLGMPSAYFWGFLAFGLNFIPYLGALLGIGLSAFVAIATFDSFGYALLMPAAYVFWNTMENQVLTPLVLGRRLQLNTVAILINVGFWSWLWGITGTLLAVPILVTIKVFCDHLESLSGIGEFLSERRAEDNSE